MNAKRTCGECEHIRIPNNAMYGRCAWEIENVPMWMHRVTVGIAKRCMSITEDATHCETFLLKQTRKDHE